MSTAGPARPTRQRRQREATCFATPLCQVRRLALNERAYGAVDSHGGATSARFVCECSCSTCDETIELEIAEYEAVRRDESRFFVSPSKAHVFPPLETIVHACGRYFVVERVRTPATALAS